MNPNRLATTWKRPLAEHEAAFDAARAAGKTFGEAVDAALALNDNPVLLYLAEVRPEASREEAVQIVRDLRHQENTQLEYWREFKDMDAFAMWMRTQLERRAVMAYHHIVDQPDLPAHIFILEEFNDRMETCYQLYNARTREVKWRQAGVLWSTDTLEEARQEAFRWGNPLRSGR